MCSVESTIPPGKTCAHKGCGESLEGCLSIEVVDDMHTGTRDSVHVLCSTCGRVTVLLEPEAAKKLLASARRAGVTE